MRTTFLLMLAIMLFGWSNSSAQSELPNEEVRAVWIATVYNMDWPTQGTPPAYQQSELKRYFKNLKQAGFNTIYFQVRTEGDALYDSEIEPWSKIVTGTEGQPPNPYWDPLEFATQEAHKLGMELHAWLNPYYAMRTVPSDFTQKIAENEIDESLEPFLNRYADFEKDAKFKGTATRAENHVSNTHPEWVLVVGGTSILDPGLQEVRDYITSIVTDIVKRYDVDGIHFDDYFYPYPDNHMTKNTTNNALDDSSFALDPRGFTNKNDWRRDNINIFMTQVNDSIKANKPWVKFGISPFGIYKSGTPPNITGLDAYSTLFTDPLKWAENRDVDYLLPQLYWPFSWGYGQDFGVLANWWAEVITERGPHLYVGHGAHNTDKSTGGGTFKKTEIPNQIKHMRNNELIKGSSFFRMKNITTLTSQGLRDSLVTNYYRKLALIPTMDWLDTTVPETPANITLAIDAEQGNKITLAWDRGDGSSAPAKIKDSNPVDTLQYYVIYRVDSDAAPNPEEVISNPENRIEITGETSFTDIAEPSSEGNYYYVVTSVSRNGVESLPSDPMDAGQVVPNELQPELATEYSLHQNYPNPFNPTTNIRFTLGSTGMTKLTVYDVLGREVATLLNEKMTAGRHEINFDASSLSSGIYIYKLESNGVNLTRKLTLIK